jgi:hypothetical protein
MAVNTTMRVSCHIARSSRIRDAFASFVVFDQLPELHRTFRETLEMRRGIRSDISLRPIYFWVNIESRVEREAALVAPNIADERAPITDLRR